MSPRFKVFRLYKLIQTNDTTSGTLTLGPQPSLQQGRRKRVGSEQTLLRKKLMAAFVEKWKNDADITKYRNELARLLPGPPNRISPSGALYTCPPTQGTYSSGELHKLVRRELKSNGFENGLGQVQLVSADFYRSGARACIRLDLQGRLGCFSDVLMICLPVSPMTKRRPSVPNDIRVTDEFIDLGTLNRTGETDSSTKPFYTHNHSKKVRSTSGEHNETHRNPLNLNVLSYVDPSNHVVGHAPRDDPLGPGATPSGTHEVIPRGHPPNIVASSHPTTIIPLGDSGSEVINGPICDDFSAKLAESTRTTSPSHPQRETASGPICQDSRRSMPHQPGGAQPCINPEKSFMTSAGDAPAVNSFIRGLPRGRRVVKFVQGVCSQAVTTWKAASVSLKPKARYFSVMTRGQADQFVAPLKAAEPSKLTACDPKIRLEDVSVLASLVSSRGSQHPGAYQLDNWFLEAMWEGLSRLCYTNRVDDVKREEPAEAVRVLVDDVMSRFGKRAKRFRSKIQRVSPNFCSTTSERFRLTSAPETKQDANKRPELNRSKFMQSRPHHGTDQPDEETAANLRAADMLARKNENLEQEKRELEDRYEELLLTGRKLK